MNLAAWAIDPQRNRKRPAAPQLRLALFVHAELLFAALEHAGARVTNGAWIEPLRHHAYPRRYDRSIHTAKEKPL